VGCVSSRRQLSGRTTVTVLMLGIVWLLILRRILGRFERELARPEAGTVWTPAALREQFILHPRVAPDCLQL